MAIRRAEAATLAAKLGSAFAHRFITAEHEREFATSSLVTATGSSPAPSPSHATIAMLSGVCGVDQPALDAARGSYAAVASQLSGGARARTISFDGSPRAVAETAAREGETVGADEVMLLFLQTGPDAAARLEPVLAEINASG